MFVGNRRPWQRTHTIRAARRRGSKQTGRIDGWVLGAARRLGLVLDPIHFEDNFRTLCGLIRSEDPRPFANMNARRRDQVLRGCLKRNALSKIRVVHVAEEENAPLMPPDASASVSPDAAQEEQGTIPVSFEGHPALMSLRRSLSKIVSAERYLGQGVRSSHMVVGGSD